jgi:hypothetical protein
MGLPAEPLTRVALLVWSPRTGKRTSDGASDVSPPIIDLPPPTPGGPASFKRAVETTLAHGGGGIGSMRAMYTASRN